MLVLALVFHSSWRLFSHENRQFFGLGLLDATIERANYFSNFAQGVRVVELRGSTLLEQPRNVGLHDLAFLFRVRDSGFFLLYALVHESNRFRLS